MSVVMQFLLLHLHQKRLNWLSDERLPADHVDGHKAAAVLSVNQS